MQYFVRREQVIIYWTSTVQQNRIYNIVVIIYNASLGIIIT